MPGVAERRYCLNRALMINPSSGLARSALANLPKQPEAVDEVATQSPLAGAGNPTYHEAMFGLIRPAA